MDLTPHLCPDFDQNIERLMERKLLVVLLILLGCRYAGAQDLAIKTNLLHDASASVNAGVEVGLGPHWTADFSGGYNPWTFNDNRKWKHWIVQPELRYWLCGCFNAAFVAAHIQGGQYNIGGVDWKDFDSTRREGWFIGAGLGFGWQFILSRKLNLELELGAGYNYTRYDSFRCRHCGEKIQDDMPYNYWGITKAAIGLVYAL